MTPETRAARDRIAAFLDRRTPELHDRIAYSGPGRDFVALFASDLRLLVAALDQQPDGIISCDHVLTEAEFEALKQWWRTRHVAARHDGTLHVPDEDRPAGLPDAAQLDYRAARREQHPPTEAP